jgi:hypothetical protein
LDYDEPNSILSQGKSNTSHSSKRKLETGATQARTTSTQNVKHKSYFETLEVIAANKDLGAGNENNFTELAQ